MLWHLHSDLRLLRSTAVIDCSPASDLLCPPVSTQPASARWMCCSQFSSLQSCAIWKQRCTSFLTVTAAGICALDVLESRGGELIPRVQDNARKFRCGAGCQHV